MPVNRRKFLQQGSLAALATITLPAWASAAAKKKFITGVQLYSVREDMRKDPLGTLKAVAEMGYKNVEHANYVNRKFYGYTAAEFKKLLDDLGMKMPSGHTVMGAGHWDASKKDFTDSWKYTIEDAAIVGQELVISPSLESGLRKSKDDLLRFMEVFNKCGELCKKSGMRFGYHNHDFEFTQMMGEETMYEVMLNNTDPSMVTQQFDMGNLYGTGADALAIVKKYPGRFVSMHVKDEIKRANGNGYESTILGKGVQKVKEIIDEGLKNGGTIHFIVEQEAYQGISPMDCIREDIKVMKQWGYK
ncbi:sugar phosphate isomerase/epimerase family protein [Sediminibacterium sp.]|uniref:sugar phosphate isomerase/epimerase family protein n=1 Tax=Sediminibacterium sp. TaxID=1917865 RepID=UPI003F6A41D6